MFYDLIKKNDFYFTDNYHYNDNNHLKNGKF